MALNSKTINPLSVLGVRRLPFIPNHFAKLSVKNKNIDIKILDHWINYHLNSRYAIKKTLVLDDNKKVVEATEIGLEDPKEITLLSLGCPILHKN
jgi:hypothetical protein